MYLKSKSVKIWIWTFGFIRINFGFNRQLFQSGLNLNRIYERSLKRSLEIVLNVQLAYFLSFAAKKVTFIGATAGDEMCNLYMMYFFPPGKAADYLGCAGVQAGNEITEGKFICFDGKFKKVLNPPFPSISFSFRFLSHLRNVSRWNWWLFTVLLWSNKVWSLVRMF